MDAQIVSQLQKAGIDTTLLHHFPVVPVRVSEVGRPMPLSDEVPVESGGKFAIVGLRSIPRLFTGAVRPPSFAHGPTDEYLPFFAVIEVTAVGYTRSVGRAEYDEEMERLYRQLRRRPDGTDSNPLFSYLQAAARLYMSLRDVSRDEFEAVAQRLSVSARHFAAGPSSTNYLRSVGRHLP